MKKIRSKIILILLIAVLLPIIPLSFLVNDLVNRSYRIGVNQQVARALKNGLDFSKAVYDLQRYQLEEALERFKNENETIRNPVKISMESIKLDTGYWNPLWLGYLNENGDFILKKKFDHPVEFDQRWLNQFQSGGQLSLIISDRSANRFTAILKDFDNGSIKGYWALQASFKDEFLERADQALDVYQMYQTLDLTRHEFPQSFLLAFVALGLAILFGAVGFGIWISARMTAPITALVEGTKEIGRGNLNYRIPPSKSNDEIGQLIAQFNRMATQLKENQERMIYLEKMSAWKQMARKLAHEIKNPLSPIQLTLQQIVDKYDDDNTEYRKLLSECYGIINEEIGSLRKLVQEFSEFGRLPELELREADLNELLREISTLFGGRLQLDLQESLPKFHLDEDRLRRVIINLVQNAIQADPRHNPVKISTKEFENKIRLTVSDRGAGIPPEFLSKIFEPHFSGKKDGMGLGLAITRLIVEEHQGTIQVHSQVNEGSEFIIELPIIKNPESGQTPGNKS